MTDKLSFRDVFPLSPKFDERTEREFNDIFHEITNESFSRIMEAVILDWEYTIEHIDDKFDFIDSFYHNFLNELLFSLHGFIEGDNIEDVYDFFDNHRISIGEKDGEYYFYAEMDFDKTFLSTLKSALEERREKMFEGQVLMCEFFIKKFY